MDKSYSLLYYVEASSPKLKKFPTKDTATKFINTFKKKHKDKDDYWLDFLVVNIKGEIDCFDDYYKQFLKE